MKLIGLTGKAGVGKDTAAQWLVDRHRFVQYAFAWPIKRMLAHGLGLPMDKFEDREAKEAVIPWLGVSYRYLAQTLGTEWGRKLVSDDLWTTLGARFWKDLPSLRPTAAGLVISDVRFDNEADMIRELGGTVVHVRSMRASTLDPSAQAHSSELGVTFFYGEDLVVDNDASIDDLRKRLDVLVKRIALGVVV